MPVVAASSVENSLLFEAMGGDDAHPANVLFAAGTRDDKIIDYLNEFQTKRVNTLTEYTVNVINSRAGDILPYPAVYGRVDAGEVIAAHNHIADVRGGITHYHTNLFVAGVLGIVCNFAGRMVLAPDSVGLPDGISRERMTRLQALYRAQRIACAGGLPVDPKLVADAYPGVTLTPKITAAYAEEVRAWMVAKREAYLEAERAAYVLSEEETHRRSTHAGWCGVACGVACGKSAEDSRAHTRFLSGMRSALADVSAEYVQAKVKACNALIEYVKAEDAYSWVATDSAVEFSVASHNAQVAARDAQLDKETAERAAKDAAEDAAEEVEQAAAEVARAATVQAAQIATQSEIDQIAAALVDDSAAEPAPAAVAEPAPAAVRTDAIFAGGRVVHYVGGFVDRIDNTPSGRIVRYVGGFVDRVGAEPAVAEPATPAAEPATPAAVALAPVAIAEPAAPAAPAVAIPVGVRDAVAELTKVIATLVQLLGQLAQ